jgi:DNA-binding Xre family transcriptional regulator
VSKSNEGRWIILVKLKSIILKKRISVSELSERTSLDYKSLHNIISNKTKGAKFSTLDKIAKALDITIDELFDRDKY